MHSCHTGPTAGLPCSHWASATAPGQLWQSNEEPWLQTRMNPYRLQRSGFHKRLLSYKGKEHLLAWGREPALQVGKLS